MNKQEIAVPDSVKIQLQNMKDPSLYCAKHRQKNVKMFFIQKILVKISEHQILQLCIDISVGAALAAIIAAKAAPQL